MRDALAWSQQINESIDLFGDRMDIHLASHHWPIWGRGEALQYLKQQRDLYKYIHDQTLRLANSGLTPLEIADEMQLPASLRTTFSSRGYYGTLRHNTRAVSRTPSTKNTTRPPSVNEYVSLVVVKRT